MKSVVLDASVVLAFLLPDETSTGMAILLEAEARGEIQLLAPGICPIEALNGLAVATRRGRMGSSAAELAAEILGDLPITYRQPSSSHVDLLRLAARHGLTVYDVLYLDLALRETAPVATIDGILRQPRTSAASPWLEEAVSRRLRDRSCSGQPAVQELLPAPPGGPRRVGPVVG